MGICICGAITPPSESQVPALVVKVQAYAKFPASTHANAANEYKQRVPHIVAVLLDAF